MNRVPTKWIAPLLLLPTLGLGCASLNYIPDGPDAMDGAGAGSSESSATMNGATGGPPAAPVLISPGFGLPEEALGLADEETKKSWDELTRLARADRQRRDFDKMDERLEQAATQLADLPPSSARRRAVHGMRARLALDLVAAGQVDDANALAERLFEEVEATPSIGGPGTLDLALDRADLRAAEAREKGLSESQLPLLRIAFMAAELANASNSRLELAFRVSEEATEDGDPDLARRAIDRAVLDARIVAPANLDQLASLKVYKTRIALAQGDLVTAEAAATAANRLFDEADSDSSSRIVGEATLARVLAVRGETERAQAVAVGVRARLDEDTTLGDHSRRSALADLARIERTLGNDDEARALFDQALAFPGIDFRPDTLLVSQIGREIAELDAENEDGAQTGEPVEVDMSDDR